MGRSRKWIVDFNTEKNQLISFDWSNNTGAIDVKIDESLLEEILSFKMIAFLFFSKLGWSSYIISIAKTTSKESEALIRSLEFLSPEFPLLFRDIQTYSILIVLITLTLFFSF